MGVQKASKSPYLNVTPGNGVGLVTVCGLLSRKYELVENKVRFTGITWLMRIASSNS